MRMIKQVLEQDRIRSEKERKNIAIFETIRKHGAISKSRISYLTDVNIVTVSHYIENYIKRGLVREGSIDDSTGGRKSVLIELNPKAGYIVGVGLNVLNTIGIVTDLEMNVLHELKRDRPPRNDEDVLEHLADTAEAVIQEAGINRDKIAAVGVGIPGAINALGRTITWPQGLGEKDVSARQSVQEIFEKKLRIPTFVENDANAAAFAEKWLGFDRDIRHMLYMFSGVGVGIITNGEIYRGGRGCAGELGIANAHAKKEHTQEIAPQLGRWEIDLGMVAHSKNLIEQGHKSFMTDYVEGDLSRLTFKEIDRALQEGDALAMRVAEKAGIELGKKVAFLVNLLDPEIVVIGGGIENCGEPLMGPLKKTVREWAMDFQAKIMPSAFGENAVALGVAGIVEREVFAKAQLPGV